MGALRTANLAVAFLLELALLAAMAVWGWSASGATAGRIVLTASAPALVATLWGALLAPRSPRRLPRPWLELVKLALYGLGAVALARAGHPWLGAALVTAAAVSLALAVLWRQQEVAGRTS